MLPDSNPSNTQRSMPCSLVTTFGARSRYLAGTWWSNMSGGSMTWSSMLTRIMSSVRISWSLPEAVERECAFARDGPLLVVRQPLQRLGQLLGDPWELGV